MENSNNLSKETNLNSKKDEDKSNEKVSSKKEEPEFPPKNIKAIIDEENNESIIYNDLKIIKKINSNKELCQELYLLETQEGEKILCKKFSKKNSNLMAINERKIYSEINNPGILEFKGCSETNDYILIFFEYCENGTLPDLINKRQSLTEKEVQFYMLQLIIILNNLHNNKIIHRNLKPESLFLAKNMQLKVGNFDFSKELFTDEFLVDKIPASEFSSPEIEKGEKHSFEADIWSLGKIMYYLLTKKKPFEKKNLIKDSQDSSLMPNIKDKDKLPIFSSEYKISKAAQDLINQILVKDPKERPTLNQIIYHDFFIREGIPEDFSKNPFETIPEDYPPEILDKEVIYKDLKSLIKPSLQISTYENFFKRNLNTQIKDINNYITHFYEYDSRSTMGFRLSNGNIGVYYEDSSNMIYNIKKNEYIYIENKENEEWGKVYKKKNIPEELSDKYDILEKSINYFDKKIKQEERYNNNHKENTINKIDKLVENQIIYVEILIIDKNLIFFKLSSQIQQAFFNDNTQIIMSYDIFTYIDKDKNKTNLYFIDIPNNPIPKLKISYNNIKDVYRTYMEKKLFEKIKRLNNEEKSQKEGESINIQKI